jgi:Flp pilus assembly protein TadG
MNQKMRQPGSSTLRRLWPNQSGQALVEFSLVLLSLVFLVFCLMDFCVAIYEKQLLTNLSREAANLAARGAGTSEQVIMNNALDAIEQEATPLNLTSASGKVILSSVTNNGSGHMFIKLQVSAGSLNVHSKLGTGVGANVTTTLPTTNLVQVGGTCYVAEIFYLYKAPAPLRIVGLSNTFYDVAYFQ